MSSLSAGDPLSLSFPFRTICPQKSTRSLRPDPSPRLIVSFFEASERSPIPHHTEPLGHHCPSLFLFRLASFLYVREPLALAPVLVRVV